MECSEKRPPVLKNWQVYYGRSVNGEVYGHPDEYYPDGKRIITSTVVSISGNTITTKSGSKYELDLDSGSLKHLQYALGFRKTLRS